ncbi:MAG: hydantoinase/oxoprolinase family protein, partial [Candidatus Thiodiazotropha sp. (ex Notomyrtea botanica)]|nr:hydantoinase/oxoprolinase family protein [Candidatus Thiodiazotropha sp. (ex Notomyrtea botanica)]
MVPVHAGVLSALGMLATRPGRQLVRTRSGLLNECEDKGLAIELDALAEEGVEALTEEGIVQSDISREYSLDLRYLGQSYTLNVPWNRCRQAIEDFHGQHEARYGHRMQAPVELVNLRAALKGPQMAVTLPHRGQTEEAPVVEWLNLVGINQQAPRYERSKLAVGQQIQGPALITEMASTTWLAEGWNSILDEVGNLILSRQRP